MNDFMAISAWELEESVRITDWQKWVKRCEKLLHHSLDGDQFEDGYSLDYANEEFDKGVSPEKFAEMVRQNKLRIRNCGRIYADHFKMDKDEKGHTIVLRPCPDNSGSNFK